MSFAEKQTTTQYQAMVQQGHILEGMGSLSTQRQVDQGKITKQ